ncbi:AcrR family transcriptional regulator [Paenibacillus phyllosphaerae]|uniref:AcrR family transcriptional regulator n=1 Tax=Paenibacillus phyllosphaerae TaxID=274593 RepID=A0A7W5AZM1_9BACL|nr:TetR/AcrR family transcriptional regulator [Paenibacillus phyllosphaerae]MBB3111196.1 AcrR family transcriptional regulator [Paenibacillus phyllosphaerae]
MTNILDTIIAQAKLSKKETVKQQRIVESAIALFAEKGYANTSTSEIARASGVAEATIFRHYGTKDNLLLSVIVPFLKEFNPLLMQDVIQTVKPEDHETFEDFLTALLRNRAAFLQENKEIFQIVVKELLYREELRKDLLPHIQLDLVLKHMYKALDRYKASGELADLPNEMLMRMIFTCIGGYFATRFILLPERSEAQYEQELKMLLRFILDGVRGKG